MFVTDGRTDGRINKIATFDAKESLHKFFTYRQHFYFE